PRATPRTRGACTPAAAAPVAPLAPVLRPWSPPPLKLGPPQKRAQHTLCVRTRLGFQVARFAGADHRPDRRPPTFVVSGSILPMDPNPDRHRRQAIMHN